MALNSTRLRWPSLQEWREHLSGREGDSKAALLEGDRGETGCLLPVLDAAFFPSSVFSFLSPALPFGLCPTTHLPLSFFFAPLPSPSCVPSLTIPVFPVTATIPSSWRKKRGGISSLVSGSQFSVSTWDNGKSQLTAPIRNLCQGFTQVHCVYMLRKWNVNNKILNYQPF